MTEPYDTLLQVQDHDIALDQLRHKLEAMPERTALSGVRDRRAALTAAVAGVQALVDDLAGRQAALEEKIAASAHRRHELEERMRSGAISAARDLQAMDHEVTQLAQRQHGLEEEEIVLMEEQEPLDVELAAHRATGAALEADEERLVSEVAASEVELRAAIETEQAARTERASALPAELAERYDRLRSHLGGVGAARLIGNRCDGCHLTLPSVEIERLHHLSADTFATCPQCDRILVH